MKTKVIGYWASTSVLAFAMFAGGVADLYAEHTKKWILIPVARRACHRSTDTRTSPRN